MKFRKVSVTTNRAPHPPQLTWGRAANNARYNYPMSSEQHFLAGFGQPHKLRQVVFHFLNTCGPHEMILTYRQIFWRPNRGPNQWRSWVRTIRSNRGPW